MKEAPRKKEKKKTENQSQRGERERSCQKSIKMPPRGIYDNKVIKGIVFDNEYKFDLILEEENKTFFFL